jgi:hypothetical protein
MRNCTGVALVFVASGLAGCATATQTVTDPNTITLKQALVDTVDALAAAHTESKNKFTNFGFYGCSLTAVYNISASGTQDNKITITASSPAATLANPLSLGGTASSEATAQGSRGNTVTLVLDTPYCFPNVKPPTPSKLPTPGPVVQRATPSHKTLRKKQPGS